MSDSHDSGEVEYRPIPGYAMYRVGADGSVWSRLKRGCGFTPSDGWKRLRPACAGKKRHRFVILYDAPRSRNFHYVHRLVLEAFVGRCPEGMEACHDPDRNPDNNCLANLRWDTPIANQRDREKHGTKYDGEQCHLSRLTALQVIEIKRLLGALSQNKIAIMFGVHRATIGLIARGKNWKSVKLEEK